MVHEEWSGGRICVAISAVAATAVFLPSLANGLAYDDVALLLGDPRIRPPYAWGEIFTKPYWYVSGAEHALYRPLTTASFALDWVVAGAAAVWAHAVNVVLHVVATCLVALLLLEFVPAGAALCGAVIFAVHPVHVEAVANVAGRAELLAAVFFFGACLIWHRRDRYRDPRASVVGTAALGAAAVFSKESAVMLPAVLVLIDFAAGRWRGERSSVRSYLRSWGAGLAACLLGPLLYLVGRAAVIGLDAPAIPHPAAELVTGPGERFLTALQAWPEYARLLFFPRTLLIDYGPQVVAPARSWTVQAGRGLAILAAILALGVGALAHERRLTALTLLWFPVTIFPVSNLAVTIGVLVAERTLYVPSFALALGTASVAATALASPSIGRRTLGWVVIGTVALAFSARSLQRIPEWESTERIFRAQVRDRPDSYRGHWYLGRLERAQGNDTRAAEHFAEALRLWPYRKGLVLEAASFAIERRRIEEARSLAAFAVRQWPSSVEAYRLLAATSLDLGDKETARRAVLDGLRVDPRDELLLRMRDEALSDPVEETRSDEQSH